jgi:hypothetical protein
MATNTKKTTPKKSSKPAASKSRTTAKPAAKPNPLETVGQVAVKGLYLGLGTAVLVAENAEDFAKRAIQRGEKLPVRENLDKLASASKKQLDTVKKQLDHVKTFVQKRKGKHNGASLESMLRSEISKAMKRVQEPLKRNITELSKRLTNLAHQVNKMMTAAAK